MRPGDKELVALKQIYQKDEKEGFPITALREIQILSKLNHRNIVRLLEIVLSKRIIDVIVATELNTQLGKVYLAFEYMDHDLLGLIKKKIELKNTQIKCIMKQMIEGVKYLHDRNIVHRDIKCGNILMSNTGEIKLADFGLARFMNRTDKNYTNKVVTLWYRSPELLLGSTNYAASVDMWSIGCCFAELIKMAPLFQTDTEAKAIDRIFKKCGIPTEESWPGVTSLTNYRNFPPKGHYTRCLLEEFKGNPKYVN